MNKIAPRGRTGENGPGIGRNRAETLCRTPEQRQDAMPPVLTATFCQCPAVVRFYKSQEGK